jgi:hypothetical protein
LTTYTAACTFYVLDRTKESTMTATRTYRNPFVRKHLADDVKYWGGEPGTRYIDTESAEEAEVLRCPYDGDRAFVKPTVGTHICLSCGAVRASEAILLDGTRVWGGAISGEQSKRLGFWADRWVRDDRTIEGNVRDGEDWAMNEYDLMAAAAYEAAR